MRCRCRPVRARPQLTRTAAASGQQAERQEHPATLFAAAAARAVPTAGDRFTMLIGGRRYAKRADAAPALHDAVSAARRAAAGSAAGGGGPAEVPIGQLTGFPVLATTVTDRGQATIALSLHGIPGYTPSLTRDELATAPPLGMIIRLENLAADLHARGADAEHDARRLRQEAANAAARIGRPFEQADRLASLRARKTAIDAQLTPPEPEPAGVPVKPTPAAAAAGNDAQAAVSRDRAAALRAAHSRRPSGRGFGR